MCIRDSPKIHGSMELVLVPFRRETLRIGHGKTLVLLSLLLIFILLGIVAGILFVRLSVLSLKESATTCLGPLPKTSLTTFVNLPSNPLFALTVLLLTLLLKRPISSASFFHLILPWTILASLLLLLLLSGFPCLYL